MSTKGQAAIEKVKKSKGMNLARRMMANFSRNTTVESIVDAALYLFLGWKSIDTFKKTEMFWFGPLAYKLARTPGGAGESTVSILGSSFTIPSSQQVGLMMFGGMGLINLADFLNAGMNAMRGDIANGLADDYAGKDEIPENQHHPALPTCEDMKQDPLYAENVQALAVARVDLLISVNTNDGQLFTDAKTRESAAYNTLKELSVAYGCMEG